MTRSIGRRLLSSRTDGRAIKYLYSATGRRVGKVIAAGDKQTVVTYPSRTTRDDQIEQHSVVQFGDERAALLVQRPTATDPAQRSQAYAILNDARGATVAVVDCVGTKVLELDESAYGRVLARGGAAGGTLQSTESVFSFTGEQRDDDTGMVRMGVRDYFPGLASFGTPDPLVLSSPEYCVASPLECQLYTYVGHDPANYADEDGLQKKFSGNGGKYKHYKRSAKKHKSVKASRQRQKSKIESLPRAEIAQDAAMAEADLAADEQGIANESLRSRKRVDQGMAAALVTKDGRVYVGRSASLEGSIGNNEDLYRAVRAAYGKVSQKQRAPFHEGCAEARALDAAMRDNARLDGAVMVARQVRVGKGVGHGALRTACSSCANVLKQLGIRDGVRPLRR